MTQTANITSLGSGNINCANVTNSYNTTNTTNTTVNKIDQEDNQIKQWLSPLEPRQRHQNVQTNRVDGVGSWLLERNEFQEWSGSQEALKQSILFCYGDPGVGKTHISSLVIDWLCDQARNRDIAVAGLYCDYLAQEEQSTANMLGAILKQLLERDGIPGPVREAFHMERRGLGGRAVQLLDLVEILKTTIASLPEVFICIDGLDECRPNNRLGLLESLRDILQVSPTTRVFLSGRPHILDEIKRYFTKAIILQVIPTVEDIARYLKMRLDKDPTPSAMDGNLRAEIMSVIPRKISQIFLLVSLNIDAVLEEVTIRQRKKKLDQMIQGNGLRDAYSATLARIKALKGSKPILAMGALMWLSHSVRGLNANELCHALGVEIGSTDLDSQNIPAIETLLGCTLGLVIVEASSYTVRLVHYTLQEYLSNNADLFPCPHSAIAEVCLTYLNFQCVRDLPLIANRSTPETPLVEYASRHWGTHARREVTKSVNTLALGLLDRFDKHVSSRILLYRTHESWNDRLWGNNPTGFTGLHGAAYLGILDIAVALLEMKKWDINSTDVMGHTTLSWAAMKGHGDIVKMLLEREDVAPNAVDKRGRTPLGWAAGKGHGHIVKILLEYEDVTLATKYGGTPLVWAAAGGDGHVLEMCLKHEDATPGTDGNRAQAPFSWAARLRNPGIGSIVPEPQDVTRGTAGVGGCTPPRPATVYGYGEIVKMILTQKGVTRNTTDKYGRTALSWAAGVGRRDIVKILFEWEDVRANTADEGGRTPLSWAAGNGNGDIVKMLLERRDVTPGVDDNEGRTPLSWAAGNGHGDIVKMLMDRKDVTPNTVDKYGQTPLTWAKKCGHTLVVEMLLDRCGVSHSIANIAGQSALTATPKRRSTRVAKRPSENLGSTPRPGNGNSSMGLFPSDLSTSFLRRSKRIRRS